MPRLPAPEAQVGSEPAGERRRSGLTRSVVGLAAVDPDREALLRSIRVHEGEPVEDPPWLFKLSVAWGWVVLAAALAAMVWLIAGLLPPARPLV